MNRSPMITRYDPHGDPNTEMVCRGVKVSDIAKRAGVTHSAVSQTIYQYEYSLYKGRRMRPYIASAIGRRVSEIWPDDTAWCCLTFSYLI